MPAEGADLHDPVMLNRVIELLVPVLEEPGILVDATLGMGGHAEAVLSAFPNATVVGLDRDPAALVIAERRLQRFGGRFLGVHTVFDEFPERLREARQAGRVESDRPAAFLFDLGVSSLQIDSDDRGFAYSRDTDLDMRMDQSGSLSAAAVVNGYGVEELARVFRKYGDEPHSRRIAEAIRVARARSPITTTGQLAEIVAEATPAARRRRGHPAKRVFQAIRIEVNDELNVLSHAIERAIDSVQVGGRIVVLSYHSLEDRIVKRAFAAGMNPEVPQGMPVVPDELRPWLAPVTRGAEQPRPEEAAANPRSASAKLRAVVKVRDLHGDRLATT